MLLNSVRLLLLVCLLGTPLSSLSAQEAPQQNELWHGVIKTPNQWLRTTMYLTTKPDGTLAGYSVSNDQKSAKIPINSITRVDGKWTIEFKSVNAKFSGSDSADGKSVTGVFTQNGTDFKLDLQRVTSLPLPPAKKVYRGELNAFVRKLPMQLAHHRRRAS